MRLNRTPPRVRLVTLGATLTVVCIVCESASAAEQNIHWQSNLKTARSDSTRSSKPMLLRFTASWCGYCRKMDRTTFQDENVVKHLNGCFVPVTVDADRNETLMKALHVQGLPSLVVISPKLEVVKTIAGYQTAAALDRELKGLCAKHADERPKTGKAVATRVEPAFGGYCLPSMLDGRKLVAGSPDIFANVDGHRLLFASQEMKRRFLAKPENYLPVHQGGCPVSLREQRKSVPGNPATAAIYKGRLWFFASAAHRRRFAENPESFASDSQARR